VLGKLQGPPKSSRMQPASSPVQIAATLPLAKMAEPAYM
jgi:hypothetical protein